MGEGKTLVEDPTRTIPVDEILEGTHLRTGRIPEGIGEHT